MSPLNSADPVVTVTELEQPHRFNHVVNCNSPMPTAGIPGHVCGWQHHSYGDISQAIEAARSHILFKHRPDLATVVNGQAVIDTKSLDGFIKVNALKQPLPSTEPAKAVVKSSEGGAGAKFVGAVPKGGAEPAKPGPSVQTPALRELPTTQQVTSKPAAPGTSGPQ